MVDISTQEHLDPTGELTTEVVKKRAVRGVLILTGRTFVLNAVALVAQGFLWSFLDQYQFGVFWIVSAIVNFLSYFSDIGLGAALIQKKETPQEDDLKTTFTIQQALVVLLLAVLFILSPIFVKTHALSQEGQLLLYALGLSLIFSSLKSIPSVLMERRLEFVKFAIPQIIETLVYNVVLVYLAWRGFGISSFTYAVLVRGVIGVVAVYILQPWKPGFAFSLSSLKSLLKFGVPYQINTLLATLKDDGMVILLGGILGPSGVGVLGTAQRLAQYPLRFFMDHVTKVTFPAFARMQDNKSSLERSVTRSIFFICFLVMPSLFGLLVIAPLAVKIIPGYAKWETALIPLFFISINIFFAAVTTQLTNLLNAIGKIKITFALMLMWTVLTWIFIPILAINFGVNGAAAGYSLVGISSIIAIVITKRFVNFSLRESALKPVIASLCMGLILLVLRNLLPATFYTMWVLVIVGIVSYGVLMLLLIGMSLVQDVKHSFKTLFAK